MKSGFTKIFKEAIFQISSCYIKMKSYLRNFSNYNPTEYKELGIVISLPEDSSQPIIIDNEDVLARRMGAVNNEELAGERCQREFRERGNGIFPLRGDIFKFDRLHLHDDIILREMPVISITSKKAVPEIDLKEILDAIFVE